MRDKRAPKDVCGEATANTGEYFRSQMIRSTKRSLIDSLSLCSMMCVRGKLLKVKGRELAFFFPVRGRGGGERRRRWWGGEVLKNMSFIRGGSHSSSNPSLYPFRHTILTER